MIGVVANIEQGEGLIDGTRSAVKAEDEIGHYSLDSLLAPSIASNLI